jgi:hypothetical protein
VVAENRKRPEALTKLFVGELTLKEFEGPFLYCLAVVLPRGVRGDSTLIVAVVPNDALGEAAFALDSVRL